jgi:biopolymer transport protein ExbD
MGKAKVKRASTSIDMTAMCDVSFLLLTFFVLTARIPKLSCQMVIWQSLQWETVVRYSLV